MQKKWERGKSGRQSENDEAMSEKQQANAMKFNSIKEIDVR